MKEAVRYFKAGMLNTKLLLVLFRVLFGSVI